MKKIIALASAVLLTASAAVSVQAKHIMEIAMGNVAFDVQKIVGEWSADGVKSRGEYYDIAINPDWISNLTLTDESNLPTSKMEVDLAMSWDETYLYMWVSYEDPNGHWFVADMQSNVWSGDVVQFSGADPDASGKDNRLEFGIGKHSDTLLNVSDNWEDYLGTGYAAKDHFPADDCEIFVDGDRLTYEFRVPFKNFLTAETISEGSQCRVCLAINWSWEGVLGGYATWQLASGISGGKEAANHALITLVPGPELEILPETEAPETEPPVIEVAEVIISEQELNLTKGDTVTLTATVHPADASDQKITWWSSDTTVVFVNQDGSVVTKGAGEAKIYAKAGNVQTACSVTVIEPETEAPETAAPETEASAATENTTDEEAGFHAGFLVPIAAAVVITVGVIVLVLTKKKK